MEAIREKLKDSTFPCVFIYSGGEICPVYNEKGTIVNPPPIEILG
jgi:hypothetical protein